MRLLATNRAVKRVGFSLVELLVVIGVIATLASLTLVVVTNITDSARENATITTTVKVGVAVDDRVSAFNRSFRGRRLTRATAALERLAKVGMLPDVYDDGRPLDQVPVEPRLLDSGAAEAIARKLAFRQQFPQQYSELPPEDNSFITANDIAGVLTGVSGSNGIPDIVERRSGDELLDAARRRLSPAASDADVAAEAVRAFTDTSEASIIAESSEVLYFSLTKLAVFGASPVDADQFLSGEIADTDNDGMLEFIDNWGNPLRFYRWPTRLIDQNYDASLRDDQNVISGAERRTATLLIRDLPPEPPEILEVLLDGSTSSRRPRDPLKIDPDDPIGRIGFELARLNGFNNRPNLSLHFNEAGFHSADVFHTPLVVSAGPDEVLGLFEPNDTTNRGNLAQPIQADGTDTDLFDNITNRNRKAGGLN